MTRLCIFSLLGLTLAGRLPAAAPTATVAVTDGGPRINSATWECTPGHKVEKHDITLDSGAMRYTFLASGCVDPSHGEQRPCAEGNFGMPDPVLCNWYWGGFFQVLINGTNATAYRIADIRVIETGARGAFQIIWAHPDAEVGLRLLMLPKSNHVLAELTWKPRAAATLKTVGVRLTCYPSFFTTARHRQGARHCRTPRTDLGEVQTLQLVPERDTYLYYYDTTFDIAKGEGEGPCAALVVPAGILGGKVDVGDYAEVTELSLQPEAGQARLAFYDFAGHKNAHAASYLKAHAAEDLAQLAQMDFRPLPVRGLQVERLRSEATELLTAAGDDGQALRPEMDKLLSSLAELKAKAEGGDWKAEADLSNLLENSADLFWKLRAFAALNSAQ